MRKCDHLPQMTTYPIFPYSVVSGKHSDKNPQEEGTGSMVNNVYLASLLWVHIVCNIELESVSADNNIHKVQFFLEKDELLNLKSCLTDTLIRVLRFCFF